MPSEQAITHDFDKLLAQYPGFFKDLVSYVDDIRQYGSLKQAIVEAEQRLATANDTHADARSTMEAALKALGDDYAAKEEAFKQREVARENEAEQARITVQNALNAVLEDAQRQKDQILAEANVAAAAVAKRTSDAQEKAVAVEVEIAARADALSTLEQKITARQADLDKIETSIAALRAKIA